MTVRDYLRSVNAIESFSADHDFRAEFTFYDDEAEHSVTFVSNAIREEHDVYFDVYFWGSDYQRRAIRIYAEVYSRMRIATVEEAKFIIDHILK